MFGVMSRRTFDLGELPDSATLHSVTATPSEAGGRRALRVELTDEVTFNGSPGVDYVDQPTFVVLPVPFTSGTIEVDVLSRLNGKGPDDARAFAGLAYRINQNADHFESIYLRPLNGLKVSPPRPRDQRAIQYFAYPDWPFDRLRTEYADGRYEAPVEIGPDEWTTLRIEVGADSVTATVNGNEVLKISEPKAPAQSGAVGLFVDIGTEAYFSNLTITPA
jgi:hypothetical protein